MTADFNHSRKTLVFYYNQLLMKLKRYRKGDEIIIDDIADIKDTLDDMRDMIAVIGRMYEKDNPECVCIFDDDRIKLDVFDGENEQYDKVISCR
jgi:hypothetical protein